MALLAGAGSASAASRFYIQGRGYGHGVGMSQYGAYGYALHGRGYRFILRHYFTGTALGSVSSTRPVRVLLERTSTASFRGATHAGTRPLGRGTVYEVTSDGGDRVALRTASGRLIARYRAPLRATGPGPLTLFGTAQNGVTSGSYRGALEFRPDAYGGVDAINALGLDAYLRGVVPAEMPASWAAEALKVQAVSARTYAITTSVGGQGYDQYADTRSQMYTGVSGEYSSSSAAVGATRGQVVTYHGRPVATFFFSTSGGRTENIEDSFVGASPQPWLRSVSDPYDSISPLHTWGPYGMTMARAAEKLAGLVRGRFLGIRVVRRGASPRVVYADVLGSGGRTRVSGPTLKARFGLYDIWAYFTVITSSAQRKRGTSSMEPAGSETGGARPKTAGTELRIVGRVSPGRSGAALLVGRRRDGRWRVIGRTRLDSRGGYGFTVPQAGLYRVEYRHLRGPAIRIR